MGGLADRHNGGVEVPDTYRYLLGDWFVERSIEDHRSDTSGVFCGAVEVAWAAGATGSTGVAGVAGVAGVEAVREAAQGQPPHARYYESGTLRWSGHEMACERALLVAPIGSGLVVLRFPDGRHFVDVDLRPGACEVRHDCGADTYDINFVVRSENFYEERWQVKGPSKDYEALARYKRKGAGAA